MIKPIRAEHSLDKSPPPFEALLIAQRGGLGGSWPAYANIATLALVVATSGGTLAATHYLITSTTQISPKVLKALEGQGRPAGRSWIGGIHGRSRLRG